MHLTPLFTIVLEAMTEPDPEPPRDFDNAVEAVARRLPETPLEEIVRAVRAMNALGLIQAPYLLGKVSARTTQDPKQWITDEGWNALGMETETPGHHSS